MSAGTGDERFGRIYDVHRGALAAYCRRRVPGDTVDDVMSDVFLAAWRRVDDIPPGSELPWLYGVARNVISNHRRGLGRRLRLPERIGSQRADAVDDGSSFVSGDPRVLSALATLSSTDQELLRLRAWEELSSAEIAIALGVRASAVDMRMSRAKRRLERALGSVGFTERDGGPQIATEGLS